MSKRSWLFLVASASVVAGIAYAQYPIMDMIAGKVIQKYQSSTCEQLWQQKSQPKGPEVQRARMVPAVRAAAGCLHRAS